MTEAQDDSQLYENDPQLVEMFVNHAVELLSEIETDLLQIEEEGDDVDNELINKVFRAVHTIKGESGFVALDNIGHLAHSTENVLDLMREHKITPTHETIEALLRSFDTLSSMVEDVDNSHDVDVTPHITWPAARTNRRQANRNTTRF